MAEKVGFTLVGKIAESLIEPIQRELGYLFCFNSNFKELEAKLGELKATRNDVQAREDAEKRMRKTLGENVKLWIENADGKIVEAESLINDKVELQKGCFAIKCCPNVSLRFTLGRKGKKLSLLLVELLQSGGVLPHTGHALPMPSINMRDYYGDARDFDSRSQIMEDIIEKLRDDKTMLIGICGMGGIGKTTFAKQVFQKVKDSHKHLFEIQVMSTISNSPNFNAIQQEVAHMLGSSLKDVDGEIARAHHLRNAFSNKKVVVLLDDVWKEFDLNAFGFPLTKSSDVVVGCFYKIIYTSRNHGLWLGERNITKQEFSLKVLSFEEALNLFKRKVDLKDVDSDFNRKNEIARGIVNECKGLPLALIVAGGALIEKGTHQWDHMLNRLKKHHEHDHVIHEVLKTSYDFLEGHNERFLFLLCCLFQEDANIPIEILYRYAIGLNLFKDTSDSKEISVGVHTVVDNLIMKNLLIKVGNDYARERVVKMHDVVRDVGISIAKQDQNGFCFLDCHGLPEQEIVFSPHIKIISLLWQKRDIEVLDRMELRGSKLELLRLDSSRFYQSNIKISGNLFEVADNLKVLDIIGHYSTINEFPLFSSLAKLKMLSLVGLSLDTTTNVSSIRHLSCLEVLSFQRSDMKDLPNEISELTNLKLLDLTLCKCFIINGVLSRLTNLQELYMWGGFNDWRIQNKEVNGGDNNAAGLDELNYLHKLWKLELEVANTKQVPRGVRLFSSLTLLEQFKIRIGKEEKTLFECGEKQLWLENVRDNITSLLHELGFLIEKGITNLYISNDLDMWEKMHLNSFLSLREVVLNNCGSIITLFPPLQSQISKIEEINGLGRYLKRIEIYECNQMRHLCSTLTSRHLTNLQLLILEGCDMTEEIVNNCGEDQQLKKFEFNALETLELHHLSKLKCFCMGINEIYFHRLKRLKLERLKQFIFPTKVEIPCLEVLKIFYVPNIETLCNLVAPSLKELDIHSCDSLRYVFSNSFLISISHLEDLSIKGCKMLKGLIGVSTDVEEHWKNSIEFSNLKSLRLESLDLFMNFIIDINNLEDEEEKSQERLLFYHDEVEIPCLEVLKILYVPNIETLCNLVAPSLKELDIHSCDTLRYVFSNSFLISISHLEELSIKGCKMLKGLIGVSTDVEEHWKNSIEFSNLKSLRLESLDLFTSFVIDINNLEDEEEKSQERLLFYHDEVEIPCLEVLKILYVPNIETLCNLVAPSLKELDIHSCDSLRYVFSNSFLISISHLEDLSIKGCKMLKGLIGVSTDVEEHWKNSIEFSNLKILCFESLDQFTSFVIDINNLEDEEEKSQERLLFYHDEVIIPCLKVLQISSVPNIHETLVVAPYLKVLSIDNCDNLRYVFSKSFLISISHLEYLSISKCKMLKGLTGVSMGVEEHWKNSIEFSNLKELLLNSLDQFTSFVIDINNLEDEEEKSQEITLFYHDEVSFPCLEKLYIFTLPKINYIVGWKEGVRPIEGWHRHVKIFPLLNYLRLIDLSNLIHMYEINPPGLGVLLFQNLKHLSIKQGGKLKYLFSEKIGRDAWKHLESVHIINCGMMEVVMKKEEELLIEDEDDKAREGGGSNSLENSNFFPLLKTLFLSDLSGLRNFSDVAYTWALPSLILLHVHGCLKLEALSPGYLDSPRLDRLLYDNKKAKVDVKNTWKGDVNSALHHLFTMEGENGEEEEEKKTRG